MKIKALASLFLIISSAAITGAVDLTEPPQTSLASSEVTITTFSLSPQLAQRGSTVDLLFSITNTGSLASTVRPAVSVVGPSDHEEFISSIDLGELTINPSSSSVVAASLFLSNVPPGVYTVRVNASFTNGSSHELLEAKSLEAALVITPWATELKRIPEPTNSQVKFVETPVVLEVVPGGVELLSLSLKNFGVDNSVVVVNFSGAAGGWLGGLEPSRFVVLPGERRPVVLSASVPVGVLPGEYLAELQIQDANARPLGKTHVLFRVLARSHASEPLVLRTISVDTENNLTTIQTTVKNLGSEKFSSVKTTNFLPLELFTDASAVEFQGLPGEVQKVNGRLLVKLHFKELFPSQIASGSYKVKAIAPSYFTFALVDYVNIFNSKETAVEDLFKVTSVTFQGELTSPERMVFITLSYLGAQSINAKIGITSDSFVRTDPVYVYKKFSPGASNEIAFKVVLREGAPSSPSINLMIDSPIGLAVFPLALGSLNSQLQLGLPFDFDSIFNLGGVFLLTLAVFIIVLRYAKNQRMKRDRSKILAALKE